MIQHIFGVHNYSFFDSYWTAIHFGTGLLIGLGFLFWKSTYQKTLTARAYARAGIIILVVWEYFEVMLRYAEAYRITLPAAFSLLPHGFFEIESLTNVVSDLILGGLGLFLVYQYARRSFDDHAS